jgi:hypothetical protein
MVEIMLLSYYYVEKVVLVLFLINQAILQAKKTAARSLPDSR